MENKNKLFFTLGLGQKAGKVISGDFAVTEALKKGKVKLLIVAQDASERSKSKLVHYCEEHRVRILEAATRRELGWAIGKAERTAIAVLDENFVRMLEK